MKANKEPEDILDRSSLKENPFGVPQGYFENMQQEVMDKIAATAVADEDVAPAEPVTILTYLKPAISLAAVFAIVFGFGYGTMKLTGSYNNNEASSNETILSEVPAETSTGLSEDEIISILDISLEDLLTAQGDEEVVQIQINNEEIEEYLIENRISSIQIAMLEQY